MSRKRFIKILMSHGVARNEANKIAWRYNKRDYSYEGAYHDFLILDYIRRSFNKIGTAAEEFRDSIVKLGDVFERLKEEVTKNE